jgi:hypothetical protein
LSLIFDRFLERPDAESQELQLSLIISNRYPPNAGCAFEDNQVSCNHCFQLTSMLSLPKVLAADTSGYMRELRKRGTETDTEVFLEHQIPF